MGTEVAVHIQAIGVGQASSHVRIELVGQNRISRASPSSREVKHTLSALLEHWINPVCTVGSAELVRHIPRRLLGHPPSSTQHPEQISGTEDRDYSAQPLSREPGFLRIRHDRAVLTAENQD